MNSLKLLGEQNGTYREAGRETRCASEIYSARYELLIISRKPFCQ